MPQEKISIVTNEQESVAQTITQESATHLTEREEKILSMLEEDGVTFESIEKTLRAEGLAPPTVKEYMRFLMGKGSSNTLH